MSDENNCKHPDRLKGKPGECSPEQRKECHGDEPRHACTPPSECQKPERLRGTPGQCSPDQIRECHGDDQSHPC